MVQSHHIRRGYPITWSLVIIFAIIELSIAAWLVARFNEHHNYLTTTVRDRVRFLLFCSVWTLVFAPFFLVMFLIAPGSWVSSLAMNGIFIFVTWVFWLSGAAAITAAYNGRLDCSRHFIYCGQQNALEAFAWIEWVLLTFMFAWLIFMGVGAVRRGEGYRGPLYSPGTI